MAPLVQFLAGLIACCLTFSLASAKAGLPGIPGVPVPPIPNVPKLPTLPFPDVSQLLSGQDAVSTSLANAVTGIPFLNDYQPFIVAPLEAGSRGAGGGFDVPAGSYVFEARSYCLHAGKYFAVGGSGYLYAPLKGSKAQIIRTILERSAVHLEVPQHDVQLLIWAILARVRTSDLSPQLQADAAKLLLPSQILLLNSSAIGVVPEGQFGTLLAKIPDSLQPVVQTENSMRGLLASNATYEAMERVAVPQSPQHRTTLSPVRWSFAPQGYFVWYIPHGFSWTTTFVDVPGAVLMTQDSLGRVTLLKDRQGDSVIISYVDSSSGARVAGDSQVEFYRIRSLRFAWQQTKGGKTSLQSQTWPANEWVLVGVPNGKGRVSSRVGSTSGQELYNSAGSLRDQFLNLLRTVHGDSQTLPSLVALGELRGAMQSISSGQQVRSAAIHRELSFPFAAWESAFARSVGGRTAALVDAGIDPPINLSDGVGQPQDPGAQRLAQSPVCQELPPGPGNNAQQIISKGLSDGGYPHAGSNPQFISYQEIGNTVYWHIDLNSSFDPISPCTPGTPPYSFYGGVHRDGDNFGASSGLMHNGQTIGKGTGSAPEKCASCAIGESLRPIHY